MNAGKASQILNCQVTHIMASLEVSHHPLDSRCDLSQSLCASNLTVLALSFPPKNIYWVKQGVALTGRNTTGPLSHADPW